MFFDPALSASGKQACSSCHDPHHAFGPASAAPVEMGGPNLDRPGVRAVPSLRYLQAAPAFTEHFYDSEDEGDESVDNGPTGGLTWDGRADHGKDQAKIPLLSPFEMANKDEAAVTAALRKATYAGEFKAIFGDDAFDHPGDAFDAAAEALGTFEQSASDFYPYSSRYDAFLAGKAELTAQELRGRALFEDETKGNCASCHLSEPANDGEPPQFTDFGLIAIAVPRNAAIPPMPIPPMSISACAARCAPISRAGPSIAACSRRRPCATSRCAKASSTTAPSTRCATRSPSTPAATLIPAIGTPRMPTARSGNMTTCQRLTGET